MVQLCYNLGTTLLQLGNKQEKGREKGEKERKRPCPDTLSISTEDKKSGNDETCATQDCGRSVRGSGGVVAGVSGVVAGVSGAVAGVSGAVAGL